MSIRGAEESKHQPVNRKQAEFPSRDSVTVVWFPASVENLE